MAQQSIPNIYLVKTLTPPTPRLTPTPLDSPLGCRPCPLASGDLNSPCSTPLLGAPDPCSSAPCSPSPAPKRTKEPPARRCPLPTRHHCPIAESRDSRGAPARRRRRRFPCRHAAAGPPLPARQPPVPLIDKPLPLTPAGPRWGSGIRGERGRE